MSRRRVAESPRTPPYKRLYEQAIRQVEELTLQYESGQVQIAYWKHCADKSGDELRGMTARARQSARDATELDEENRMLLDDIQALALAPPPRVIYVAATPEPQPAPVSFWRRLLWAS